MSRASKLGTITHAVVCAERAAALTHDFPFDPTHGYGLEELLAIPAPDAPDDFDAFWRDLYQQARQVDVAARLGPLEDKRDGFNLFGVHFTTLGGQRLGGWLAVPDGPIKHNLVISHGYAGRDRPELELLPPNTAAIYPCARGLGARSRMDALPDDSMRHILHGIEARERYVLGGCAADIWCAASAVLQLVPSLRRRLGYVGTSFGGGVGALALPWDDRFAAAHLTVPSFGHHPLRLTLRCTGSGEAIRHHHATRPETIEVLRYFDAASAAGRIHIPVQVAAALFDPAVPPPGQFAVHNALPDNRRLVLLSAGHFEHANTAAELRDLLVAQRTFLTAHL